MRTRTVLVYASPFAAAMLALFLGAYGLTPRQVVAALHGALSGIESPERAVLLDIRLPRIVLAGMVGMALSLSGATFQAVMRNPLVDPFILGVSAGAACTCAFSIAYAPAVPLPVAAFLGGSLAAVLAYLVAHWSGAASRLSLVLSGVVISAFFNALLSIVKFVVDPHKLQSIVYWLMGSFSLAEWSQVRTAGLGVLIGGLPLLLLRWRMNLLSMGEEEAAALGVNVARLRLALIGGATLTATSAVAVCGIIGWIGLMVPHLVRMLVGPDHRRLLPLAMAGGAAFMIVADTVARDATRYDLPVGIVTALAGAPFFISLMVRSTRRGWGS